MSVLVIIEDDLTLRVPQYFCCNCGEAQDISPIATQLSVARFRVLGSGMTLQLELPYCRRCASTSKREPVGLMKKWLIAGLLAMSVGLIAMITPFGSRIGALAFYFTTAAILAVVFAYYSLQRPRGKQTSYYQPVQLTQVKRQSGRVLALSLCFTHARYAQAFATANKEAISRGALQVVGG
jgi:hypothetical protein